MLVWNGAQCGVTRVNCAKRGMWPEPEGQAHRIGFVLRQGVYFTAATFTVRVKI